MADEDPMFRTGIDENDVETSCNSHAAESYDEFPQDMMRGATVSFGPQGIAVHQSSMAEDTRNRVLSRLGTPGRGMTFEGDLLPRAVRAARKNEGE